jgi:splicing factor 3A subunit 3
MNSVVEDSRQIAEDVDFYEKELTKLLSSNPVTHRDKLSTNHKASDLLSRISTKSASLLDTFLPGTLPFEEKEREVLALTGGTTTGTPDLTEFYKRLAKVKEYHRKYPDVAGVSTGSGQRIVDFAALQGGDEDWLDRKFTGEEGLGRYVDLHELHEVWNNLAPVSTSGSAAAGGWKRLTYLQYLEAVNSFALSPSLKSSPAYATYLTKLLSYLTEFYEKAFPLGDLDAILKKADQAFSKKWEKGEIKGWAQAEEAATTAASEAIWCSACAYHSSSLRNYPLIVFSCQAKNCIRNKRFTQLILPPKST